MKKVVLILVMLLLTLTSCGKERIEDMSKLEARDGLIYAIGETKPYTGTFIKKYEDGSVMEEKKYQDGKLNGINKTYYKNGKLWTKFNYKNNKIIYQKFYNENGKKISLQEFLYPNGDFGIDYQK